MSEDIFVPAMGESITQASIGEIFKESGVFVEQDEEVLEIETDKVNQVIYASCEGVLELFVKEGDVVAVGDRLASIHTEAEPKEQKPKVEKKEKQQQKNVKERQEGIRKQEESFVSSLKVGKVQDVPQSAPKPPEEEKVSIERPETRIRLPKVRQVIAERLVTSLKTTAQLTTFNEIDLTRVMAIRERNKEDFLEKHGVKLGFMSFFVKAVTSALFAYPAFNSYIEGDEWVQRHYINMGIAVGTDKGLFVPVLPNVDRLSFAEIEQLIATFAKKAREGKLEPSDLIHGCFTITNGGTYGSMLSTPILNPPQCGILGMHQIQKRAVVVEEQIVIRPMMYVALSYDHRVVDGKEAVSFLVHIKKELEDPSKLILEL